MGCHGLLTTPFVYQLLMTLLVMMLQLVLVMRPRLAMMLADTGDSCRAVGAWCWQCSWYPCGLQLLVRQDVPHKWTNIIATIHTEEELFAVFLFDKLQKLWTNFVLAPCHPMCLFSNMVTPHHSCTSTSPGSPHTAYMMVM